MENCLKKEDVIKNSNILTEQELHRFGLKRMSFVDAPGIEVDDIEEYARANGYINQDEYNKRINNAMNK